ncbi:hydantoinase/oxoprolinase family protein [Halobellus sp. Atlit-38R]|uniref:hydantoinase/oxoprolinase family protein n=1 Tax=Halobellus sp. Atlit-38R TaxID=2282131 RepID=UPI000EF227A9|nr:hydantoinase/oxoprolinase family protein [Halobellus sp. Atlit-38R]RLM89304.1 hydantoinase/oxoprolinase family protein [Halobellus sp. Atlit-38R]
MTGRIRLGADVGGTFTDVVLATGEDLVTAKVPSTADQSVGVLHGVEKACEDAGIDPTSVDEFTHAMTVSVNALLERAGAKTALVTTEGFRDVLEIGRQDRPDLYDLSAERPEPLVPRRRRFEIPERSTPEGIEAGVDEEAARDVATEIRECDAESVAVSLLHAYAAPQNEQRVVELLKQELDVPISASHEVLAEFREYERTSTTVVDAYVTPAIDRYLGRLSQRAVETGLPEPLVMQANGGIAAVETVREHAVTTTMSGPAAGVVGANAAAGEVAEERGRNGLVTFDMGGTSSDVSLIRDGEAERTTAAEINGQPVRTPMVDVTTVGAGGGSIAWVDSGGALRVGPESAGSDPGPACYGNGGTDPTVTDANFVLGYIGESTALGGELALDADAAFDVLADLADEAGLGGPLDAARGVYRVANANMARAIRSATVERGHDPREFGLVAFGGAGPMHACALADDLDIGTVVVPPACGVLSAYGLLAADEKHDAVRTHRVGLADVDPAVVDERYDELEGDVLADARDPDAATVRRRADLRYAGQSFELTVDVRDPFDPDHVEERFHEAHASTYGYRMDEPVDLVNLRVSATTPRRGPATAYEAEGDAHTGEREATFGGERTYETPVYDRTGLEVGRSIGGPAVIEQAESTVVVPPIWDAEVRADGSLVLVEEDR